MPSMLQLIQWMGEHQEEEKKSNVEEREREGEREEWM